jgi:NADH-quinone oxidoreductase subunit A
MLTENHDYLFLAIFLAIAVIFPIIPIGLAKAWAFFFSPPKPSREKNATYECGLESQADAWIQFHAEYYLYAIIFLVFDVEILFLLPFGVVFLQLPVGASMAMLVFLLLLAEGLAWAWKRGILHWK